MGYKKTTYFARYLCHEHKHHRNSLLKCQPFSAVLKGAKRKVKVQDQIHEEIKQCYPDLGYIKGKGEALLGVEVTNKNNVWELDKMVRLRVVLSLWISKPRRRDQEQNGQSQGVAWGFVSSSASDMFLFPIMTIFFSRLAFCLQVCPYRSLYSW